MSDTIDTRLAQARALHTAQDYKSAETLLRALLAEASDDARVFGLLGFSLFEQRKLDAAQKMLTRAADLHPEQAEYHHNLGVILAVQGAVRQAEGEMREAIRLKPDYAEAFYSLSSLVKLRRPDPLTDQIETLLVRRDTTPQDRCFLHFAAGKLFDDLKLFDRAFDHYQQANAAKGVVYDPAAQEALVRQSYKVFTHAFLRDRHVQAISTRPRPVFIVGMPRSGTSLTEQILSCHSQVFGAGELPDISAIAGSFSKHTGGTPYPDSVAKSPKEVLHGFGRHYLKQIAEMAGDAPIVVNKMPLDFRYLGVITSMFSDPIILHCTRDPLDTCLSNYFQNFKPGHDFAFGLDALGHYYRMYHSLMVHWQKVLPVPIIEVQYEALVAAPEAESKRILSEMGLVWEQACAAPHQSRRAVRTASWWQVRQPIYTSAQKRWKNYAKHLGPLRDALEGRS